MPPTVNPNLRNSRVPVLSRLISSRITVLIQLKFLEPVHVFIQRFLDLFLEQEIAEQQIIHVGSHEAEVGVFRRADDRFATHIERGVDDHRAAVFLLKLFDHPVVKPVVFLVDRLHPR